MFRPWLALPALTLFASCGAHETGRLSATLLTSTCSWNGQEYLGVADFRVALEYTPNNLAERELPPPGSCDNQTVLFAEESAIAGGSDLPHLDGDPAWKANRDSGSLTKTEPGLWVQDVYGTSPGGCGQVQEVVTDGVTLIDGGLFTGASTPAPSPVGIVKIDGVRDDQWNGEVGIGNPMVVSWDGAEWEETFIQIRQANGPTLRDVVTCNTTGTSSFNADSAFWNTVTDMGSQRFEVYVGFQNRQVQGGTGGEDIETITRVAHVLKSPLHTEP